MPYPLFLSSSLPHDPHVIRGQWAAVQRRAVGSGTGTSGGQRHAGAGRLSARTGTGRGQRRVGAYRPSARREVEGMREGEQRWIGKGRKWRWKGRSKGSELHALRRPWWKGGRRAEAGSLHLRRQPPGPPPSPSPIARSAFTFATSTELAP